MQYAQGFPGKKQTFQTDKDSEPLTSSPFDFDLEYMAFPLDLSSQLTG